MAANVNDRSCPAFMGESKDNIIDLRKKSITMNIPRLKIKAERNNQKSAPPFVEPYNFVAYRTHKIALTKVMEDNKG